MTIYVDAALALALDYPQIADNSLYIRNPKIYFSFTFISYFYLPHFPNPGNWNAYVCVSLNRSRNREAVRNAELYIANVALMVRERLTVGNYFCRKYREPSRLEGKFLVDGEKESRF